MTNKMQRLVGVFAVVLGVIALCLSLLRENVQPPMVVVSIGLATVGVVLLVRGRV